MKTSEGAKVQNGANEGAMHPRCKGANPYIGNCTIAAPAPPEKVQTEKPLRILLSEAASKHLTATGERCFIVASRAMRGTEEPDTAGRWAIWLTPCTIEQGNAAVRVATGQSLERKPKAPKA